jgi:glycosyltransferase involved in cell wall biosynthesis
MHVCMITREFPPTAAGIGYYVYYLSKKLIQKGHEVDVITRRCSGQAPTESMNGIRVFRAPYNWSLYPFNIFLHSFFVNMLLKSIESKLSLVHLHSPLPPLIKTSLPVITTVHSPCKRAFQSTYRDTLDLRSLAEQLQSMVVCPLIESRILKLSKKITSVSLNVSEELSAYRLSTNNITVVGNGVDDRLFIPKQTKNQSNSYVLFVGILRSGKGVFDLIDCAKYVCAKRPDVRFIICGRGPLLQNLKERVLKLDLQKQVIFLGYEQDREILAKLYQNAALLVQPSYHEGLSTVVLEAMSCGVPVVASDIAGNRTVISSGSNGILVPPKSPKAMANVVLKLLKDLSLRERIGNAARATIEKHYSWDTVVDKVLKCYKKILE